MCNVLVLVICKIDWRNFILNLFCKFQFLIIFWEQIRQLEKELEEVEEKKKDYEKGIEEESQSQGRDLQLEESQVSIYVFIYLFIFNFFTFI